MADTGDVDEHIDRPDLRGDAGKFCFTGDIEVHKLRADAGRHGGALRRIAVGDDHTRAGADQSTCDRGADARGAAGDKRGFLGEGKHLNSAPHLLV